MPKPKINKKLLLWIDMEMTGLDPASNRILEIGMIVTDWRLNPKAELTLVCKQSETLIKKRFQTAFWQEHAATAQALIDQNATGLESAEFEARIVDFIKREFRLSQAEGNIVLAGNTIRADRGFIDRYLPEVAKFLHYRMLDVSAFKVLFEARYKKVFAKPENHRALEDIQGSIDELKYFMQYIKVK